MTTTTGKKKQPATLSSFSLCDGNTAFPHKPWQRYTHCDTVVCANMPLKKKNKTLEGKELT